MRAMKTRWVTTPSGSNAAPVPTTTKHVQHASMGSGTGTGEAKAATPTPTNRSPYQSDCTIEEMQDGREAARVLPADIRGPATHCPVTLRYNKS